MSTAEDFVITGTAEDSMYGICESLWKPDMVCCSCVVVHVVHVDDDCVRVRACVVSRIQMSCLKHAHNASSPVWIAMRSLAGVLRCILCKSLMQCVCVRAYVLVCLHVCVHT